MRYSKTVIVIPGYGLDSLPYDITDEHAAGLLNAFAVAWHPDVLAHAEAIPSWQSADDQPDGDRESLVIIPEVSEERLYGAWLDDEQIGAKRVVRGVTDRKELLAAVLSTADEEAQPAVTVSDLYADCMSLGIAHLLMELLTQQMHYFSNIDEDVLQHQALQAAQALNARDEEKGREHLEAAYETLVEARERFYPVDCFLVDLCLLNAEQANEHLVNTLATNAKLNILVSGDELKKLSPEVVELLRSKLVDTEHQPAQVNMVGGELSDVAAPIVPLESWLADFRKGRDEFQSVLGVTPQAWARRRFGFSSQVPQVLERFGYNTALHFALDDGLYPDAEHSKLSWEGCNGSIITAMSRIPIAVDSGAAILRLPERIAESMQSDMVAAIVFARWPEMRTEWLRDLQRIQSYGDVFGKICTLDTFAQDSGDAGHASAYEAREYLAPFLIQIAALGDVDACSRFMRQHERRIQIDTALATSSMTALLSGSPSCEAAGRLEDEVEAIAEDHTGDVPALEQVAALQIETAQKLAGFTRADLQSPTGHLVFNQLSFARSIPVHISDTETRVVDLPGFGFAWVDSAATEAKAPGAPLAEKSILRNGLFEVHINEATGGIGRIKHVGRRPNRLSQQLAFRFEKERNFPGGEDDIDPPKSAYTQMRCREIKVLRSDNVVGEVETTGDLFDQVDNTTVANFRQTVRVTRGIPNVEVEIELSDLAVFPEGNPWLCYYACRFAWEDSTSALTRSVFGQAQGFSGDRFDSPHYLEIASDDQRTTIINHGLPFHRKTDMRMLDSLMIVEGENLRRFKFTIAIDQNYPQQAALSAMTPPLMLPTGKPAAGTSGWFLNVSAKNVIVSRFGDVSPDAENQEGNFRYTIRLIETEGRASTAKLSLVRKPIAARKTDFNGKTLSQLNIDQANDVVVEMGKNEICDIEISF